MSQAVTQPQVVAPEVFGVMAEFDGPEALLAAAARVRDAGHRRFDVHTPYPVHGMDQAMGLGRSKLGWIVLAAGTIGALTGLGLQWYANTHAYPLITGGKPYFSWQAFMPVIFEMGVLFASFGAVIGMLAMNGLPAWYHPTLKSPRFLERNPHGFFLVVEARDARFDAAKVKALLEAAGGKEVVELEA